MKKILFASLILSFAFLGGSATYAQTSSGAILSLDGGGTTSALKSCISKVLPSVSSASTPNDAMNAYYKYLYPTFSGNIPVYGQIAASVNSKCSSTYQNFKVSCGNSVLNRNAGDGVCVITAADGTYLQTTGNLINGYQFNTYDASGKELSTANAGSGLSGSPGGSDTGANQGQGLSSSGGTATFVPLNDSLPGIKDFAASSSIPNLLNNIYKIAIGLAAVLAVLQIMRAGVLYMGGDSITEKKQAKDLIATSILGLVLVLTPTIVFSIINPSILTLQIGADSLHTNIATPDNSEFNSLGSTLFTDTSSNRLDATARCKAASGTIAYTCTPPGGKAYVVGAQQACKAGEDGINVCKTNGSVPSNIQSCTNTYDPITIATGFSCTVKDQVIIPRGCCANLDTTNVCCGKLK